MENFKGKYKISDNMLNFRKSYDLDSDIVNVGNKDEIIEVYETLKQNNFVRARTNKGWTTLFHPDAGLLLTKIEEVINDSETKVNELRNNLENKINDKVNDNLEYIELKIKDTINNNAKILKDPKKIHARCHDIKEYLKAKYPNGFNIASLPDVTTQTMRYVAHMKRLTGSEKKKLVIDSMSLLLDETDSGALEFMDPIIKEMLPNIIDTIVNVERKKIKINKSLNKYCCCCTKYV